MLAKCFLLLLTLSSYAAILADMPMTEENEEKVLCTKDQCSKNNAKSCRCYCSVKCGPREITPTDSPKYDEADQQCFCAPRDKSLYHRNSCDIRDKRKLQNK
jgi:hypothetical protein